MTHSYSGLEESIDKQLYTGHYCVCWGLLLHSSHFDLCHIALFLHFSLLVQWEYTLGTCIRDTLYCLDCVCACMHVCVSVCVCVCVCVCACVCVCVCGSPLICHTCAVHHCVSSQQASRPRAWTLTGVWRRLIWSNCTIGCSRYLQC